MSEQDQLGPSHDGSVMVDIGGEMGALVIETGPDMVTREIEISGTAPGSPRTHVAVRARLGSQQPSRYAAVFPSLRAGDYTLWRRKGDDDPAGTVTVTGDQVAMVDWT